MCRLRWELDFFCWSCSSPAGSATRSSTRCGLTVRGRRRGSTWCWRREERLARRWWLVVSPTVFRANYDLPLAFGLTAAMALWSTWREGVAQRVLWSVCTAGCLLLVVALHRAYQLDALVNLRNFYGSLRVKQTLVPAQAGTSRVLLHGTIQHGMQWFAPEFRTEPLTYYARDSGVGLAMRLCCESRPRRVGVIGLGTGTMAAYGREGDVFRFYEMQSAGGAGGARTLHLYARDSRAGGDGGRRCAAVAGAGGAATVRCAGSRCVFRGCDPGAPADPGGRCGSIGGICAPGA